MSSDIAETVAPVSSSMGLWVPFIVMGIAMDGLGLPVLFLNNPATESSSLFLYVPKQCHFLDIELVTGKPFSVSFVFAKVTVPFFKLTCLRCVFATAMETGLRRFSLFSVKLLLAVFVSGTCYILWVICTRCGKFLKLLAFLSADSIAWAMSTAPVFLFKMLMTW